MPTGNYVSAGDAYLVDADASAFIAAAGISDSTQQLAIKTLCIQAKLAGIWSKIVAAYPFVGGAAATHKWNLKDPRDLDAAFRLLFVGGWTHSANGAAPDGSTGYANTFLTPAAGTTQNSASQGCYIGNDILTAAKYAMGAYGPIPYFYICPNQNTAEGTVAAINTNNNIGNKRFVSSLGFHAGTRTAADQSNNNVRGSQTAIAAASNAPNSSQIYIGAANNSGSAINFCTYQFRFAFVGTGLTANELYNLGNIIHGFQTQLGRAASNQ